MMAAKDRVFQDRSTEELIMSSPNLCAHKRIGRVVRNFDNAICDRVREDAALAGTFAQVLTKPGHDTASSEHWHHTCG